MRTLVTLSVLGALLLFASACSGTAPAPEGWHQAPVADDPAGDPTVPPRADRAPAPRDDRSVTLHPEGGGPVAMAALAEHLAANPVDRSAPDWRTSVPAPPASLPFDRDTTYEWLLDTDRGDLRIRLLPETAPAHVASTMWLTSLGFYDGLTFHRVIPGFMAQGGCPVGNGTGNPGYAMDGEYPIDGPKHDRPGIVSIANAGPGTDGCQFFVTFKATPWLDGRHTVFGELVDGDATLRALEALGTASGAPGEPITILKAQIVAR